MGDTRIGFLTANKLREVAPEIVSDKGWYKETGPIFKHGGALLLNTAFEEVPNLGYAPTQSSLQKWLRENHKIICCVMPYNNIHQEKKWECFVENVVYSGYNTYEEALEIGLQEALDILKSVADKGDSVSYD